MPISFGLVIVLVHCSSGCILSNVFQHPWLIRIWLNQPVHSSTIAHGSLISVNKVLTGAHIADELDKKLIHYDREFNDSVLAMTGYNSVAGCHQTQYAEKIYFHWKFEDRKNPPFKYCQLGEFALLIPFEWFETTGEPFLIPTPYSGKAEEVESWVHKLAMGNETQDIHLSAHVYMFADSSENSFTVIANTAVPFMSFTKCVEMDNFKKIQGELDMKDPGFKNFSFFCSDKIPGESGSEQNNFGFGYDWYQGAPVMVEVPESQNRTKQIAIGQYLFWTGESGIPFVFSTYTQLFFDFLEGEDPNLMTSSPSTEPSWPKSRPSIITESLGPISRQAMTGMTMAPKGLNSGQRQSRGWIVFGLVCVISSNAGR